MSIKSQKSLNEELSEIVERSYSVRSASDESLSCDSSDEGLAHVLLRKLSPAALSRLRRRFRRAGGERVRGDLDRRVELVMRAAAAEEGIEFAADARDDDPRWLDEAGLVGALDGIFGHNKYSPHARALFSLLDPFSTGRVRWRALVARLLAAGARATRSRAEGGAVASEGEVVRLRHCKREAIVKLVSIETEDSFCYAAVSRGGRVGIYSGLMKLVHSYEVFYHRTGINRRVKNCWITDAIYLHDVQCLLLSASDRSLTVYDAATQTHAPLYCITGLPNIPTCMAYSPSHRGGPSELVLGTELGDIIRLRFLQPRVSLFYTKSADHINYYFWMELSSPTHSAYCCAHWWRRAHARSVRRLQCARARVLSCSHDGAASMRARHVLGKLEDYVFRVQRGITCFHFVPALHLVATGGRDGVVRLWEPTQASPFASLAAPAPAAALDVAVLAAKEIVVAYYSNCWLHIWDLYEECLLQTIKIHFPVLGVLGKKVEFGAICIHPGPARKILSEPEEGVPPDPLPTTFDSSRRSSVHLGSTGGLMLQDEEPDTRESKELEDDAQFVRFDRPDLLITCCDYVCRVHLGDPSDPGGSVMPPPGGSQRARRPSAWDLPDDIFTARSSTPHSPRALAHPAPPTSNLLSPSAAENPAPDLDSLLENAGLQGILQKDFVLMYGLKHDLNRKLAELEANKEAMTAAVSLGAPYLALQSSPPAAAAPARELSDVYRRVMKLFPGPSVSSTPVGSETSTPRKRSS